VTVGLVLVDALGNYSNTLCVPPAGVTP
jgi:hypothetical protein